MRRWSLRATLSLLSLAVVGCGGSGGSGGGGVDGPGVVWPDRGGGSSTTLPPSVVTGRVVFSSASGEQCCVAVDPTLLTPAGSALLVLDDLPPGPATVTIAGFPTDFAPAVPGITETCKTVRSSGVEPCDPTRAASASFESAPLPVNIVAGAQINLGDVAVSALPFVLEGFAPAQDEAVQPTGDEIVNFDFTVADAVTGVAADSVALDLTVNVPDTTQPSQFRALTKRIPLTLTPCTDGSGNPCNKDADQDLAGFGATGIAQYFPAGPAEVRITAQNLADPAKSVDFRYAFEILPVPTATPTTAPSTETPTVDAAAVGLDSAADPDGGDRSADRAVGGADYSDGDSEGGHAGPRYPTPTPTETPAP
ncbi:MAG: hypothetical protein SF182_14835 [Deltaproteobacteria bacterium]|nr:hypothetical protein [Deltaproteobacteria bacterium]